MRPGEWYSVYDYCQLSRLQLPGLTIVSKKKFQHPLFDRRYWGMLHFLTTILFLLDVFLKFVEPPFTDSKQWMKENLSDIPSLQSKFFSPKNKETIIFSFLSFQTLFCYSFKSIFKLGSIKYVLGFSEEAGFFRRYESDPTKCLKRLGVHKVFLSPRLSNKKKKNSYNSRRFNDTVRSHISEDKLKTSLGLFSPNFNFSRRINYRFRCNVSSLGWES